MLQFKNHVGDKILLGINPFFVAVLKINGSNGKRTDQHDRIDIQLGLCRTGLDHPQKKADQADGRVNYDKCNRVKVMGIKVNEP